MATNQWGQTYNGNDDFRGWLAAQGAASNFVGNDGGINRDQYLRSTFGNSGAYGADEIGMANQTASIYRDLYNKWSSQRPQADSSPQQPRYPGTSYGDGGAAARAAAEDRRNRDFTIGQIDQSIGQHRDQEGNLDRQWSAGRNSIEDQYNKGMSRLNDQYGGAMSKYATQRGDTKRSFMNSSEDNQTSARNNYQALMQMLGRAGAGRSSAAENVVPYAVSNTASKQQGSLSDDYALNNRNIKTAEDDTTNSYNNSKADMGDQRHTSLGNLEREVQGKRGDIQSQIAQLSGQRVQAEGGSWQQARDAMAAPLSRVQQIQGDLAGLADRYRNPYTVKDVQVKEAQLKNYALDPKGVAIDDPSGTGYDTDTSAEYLAQLKKEEDRKKQQSGLAFA